MRSQEPAWSSGEVVFVEELKAGKLHRLGVDDCDVGIYFFGGESIKYFALALIIGIFSGAYSSFFVAAPILVWFSVKRP